ncbi:hypothetical protein RhiTH_005757 [Rhizoctonia solani]
MSVLDIPELLLATLGYLDQSSLGKCAQVCRAWREPATELLWAQVQDLECLVNKSFTKNALSCFSNPAWNRLIHKPYPELASPPNSPRGDDQPEGTEPTLAQACWRVACQDAIGLTSFSIRFTGESDNKEYFGGFLEPYWAYSKNLSPSLSRFPFVLSRPWKHIELPGRLVGKYLFSALASISTLETLTIHGSLKSSGEDIKYKGALFKSLRELRLLDVSTIGEEYFTGLVLHNVRDLELRYLPEREKVTSATILPTVNLAAMAQACPNLLTLIVTANDIAEEGKFVKIFENSDFEPLLALNSLEKLVVRVPRDSSLRLSDDFLDRAARSWPSLRELDMDQAHSSKTLVTLQGLAPFSQYCPRLCSLQLGIRQDHTHTVFNADLYSRRDISSPGVRCSLTYLNIGCPCIYKAEAVSDFFSALFPNLRQIECPKPSGSVPYSQGDYFVWSQVVRTVQELDRDLEYLARTLRARDLAERHESINGEFIVSSIDDSDEDYWAYSGSEDDSYSSDED